MSIAALLLFCILVSSFHRVQSSCFGCCKKRSSNFGSSNQILPIDGLTDTTESDFNLGLFKPAQYSHSHESINQSTFQIVSPPRILRISPANWFDIDLQDLKEGNQHAVSGFLVTSMAFHILSRLHFLGLHLPLADSKNTHAFQRVYDYFVQFRDGIESVDLEQAIDDFVLIRNQTIHLWDIITKNDKDIDEKGSAMGRVLESQASNSHKKLIKSKTFHSETDAPKPRYLFWELRNQWLSPKKHAQPSQLDGVSAKQKPQFIRYILEFTAILMNRFYALIAGEPAQIPMHIPKSFTNIYKRMDANNLFLKNYFRNTMTDFHARPTPSSFLYAVQAPFKVKMCMVINKDILLFNSIRYMSYVSQTQINFERKHRRKRRSHFRRLSQFEATLVCKWLKTDKQMQMNLRFNAHTISPLFKFHTIEKAFQDAISSGSLLNITFLKLTEGNSAPLFLLDVILNFASFGNRCGIELDETRTFVKGIICRVDMTEMDAWPKGNIISLPRNYVRRNNETREWGMKVLSEMGSEDIHSEQVSRRNSLVSEVDDKSIWEVYDKSEFKLPSWQAESHNSTLHTDVNN